MGISILSSCFHFHFHQRSCLRGKRLPTAPYTLVNNNNNVQISLTRGGYTGWAEKKTFSYNSGSLANIIRLLFNTHDALWHQRLKFVIHVHFKMAPQRDKVSSTSLCETKWVKLQPLPISHNSLCNQKAHEQWRKCHRCASSSRKTVVYH